MGDPQRQEWLVASCETSSSLPAARIPGAGVTSRPPEGQLAASLSSGPTLPEYYGTNGAWDGKISGDTLSRAPARVWSALRVSASFSVLPLVLYWPPPSPQLCPPISDHVASAADLLRRTEALESEGFRFGSWLQLGDPE